MCRFFLFCFFFLYLPTIQQSVSGFALFSQSFAAFQSALLSTNDIANPFLQKREEL